MLEPSARPASTRSRRYAALRSASRGAAGRAAQLPARGARRTGARVAAYGAAAKGNTLLNSAGVGPDDIAYVVDRSPHKQGLFLPGIRTCRCSTPSTCATTGPTTCCCLPWNLRDEITQQMADVRDWGCRFVVPVPRLEVFA